LNFTKFTKAGRGAAARRVPAFEDGRASARPQKVGESAKPAPLDAACSKAAFCRRF